MTDESIWKFLDKLTKSAHLLEKSHRSDERIAAIELHRLVRVLTLAQEIFEREDNAT